MCCCIAIAINQLLCNHDNAVVIQLWCNCYVCDCNAIVGRKAIVILQLTCDCNNAVGMYNANAIFMRDCDNVVVMY